MKVVKVSRKIWHQVFSPTEGITNEGFEGRILKQPGFIPRAYISWSSKIGPIEGLKFVQKCSKI